MKEGIPFDFYYSEREQSVSIDRISRKRHYEDNSCEPDVSPMLSINTLLF